MDINDGLHRRAVREFDIVEETAAQKRVRQFLFIVRGNDNDRALDRFYGFLCFIHKEFHAIEFLKQVVWKLDIGLVNFVDQKNGQLRRGERFPKLALLDVIFDVVDAFITQLAIAQTGNGVIFIQALMGLGRGFDVPFNQRRVERGCYFLRKDGFAGAGFAFNEKRAA